MKPLAADIIKQRRAGNQKDNPDALCLPMGFMQLHTHPQPRKMIQTPGLLVIIYEANYGLRQIFTDGRTLPNEDAATVLVRLLDRQVGGRHARRGDDRIEGDGWLDVAGHPVHRTARITERFRRLNYGTLEIDVTVDDRRPIRSRSRSG